MKHRLLSWIQPLLTGVGLVVLWYLVKRLAHIPSYVLPAPDEILRAAWDERAVLASAMLVTSRGALLGFVSAVGVGFLLAMALGFSPRVKRSFYPFILILQMMPITILAP